MVSFVKRLDSRKHRVREELEENVALLDTAVEWTTPNGGVESAIRNEYEELLPFLRLPEMEGGYRRIGHKGKKIQVDFLWKEWRKGSDVPPLLLSAYQGDRIAELQAFWRRPLEARLCFIEEIEDTVRADVRPSINSALTDIRELFNEREALLQSGDLEILQNARIIGATTSGAARYRNSLSSVAPGVIVVEEAGEVLESHVLTSLSSSSDEAGSETKHLIMIGDHKQLRPKVESYNLTKVAGQGYDLDVLLFERLNYGRLPSVSLSVQHRMRPTVSQFVREQTCPKLIDHESVATFPDVKGVSSNVIFIDHGFKEDSQESDSIEMRRISTTKSNDFEAKFCVEIVRFFLLQGYHPRHLVVMTPYLGQLFKIVNTMQSGLCDVTAYISEQDLENFDDDEIQELESKSGGSSAGAVRCSSIDNYQGEESDIVVISLVRCNDKGAIGFLKEEQRVNVLLSRARYGMFIVGSLKTLLHSAAGRDTWAGILTSTRNQGRIRGGLPSLCSLHPEDRSTELCYPADFKHLRPNGGANVHAHGDYLADTCVLKCAFLWIKVIDLLA